MSAQGVSKCQLTTSHQVVEALEEGSPSIREEHGDDESADKALHRLLGTEADKRRLAKHHSADVCENVVADDQARRHVEPNQAFEDVVHEEMAADDDEEERHVDPAEETELLLEILATQIEYKGHKAKAVEHEGEEPVVSCERDEVCIDKDDVLEVVDHRLAVQEVVGDSEEVPASERLLSLHSARGRRLPLTSSESCSKAPPSVFRV